MNRSDRDFLRALRREAGKRRRRVPIERVWAAFQKGWNRGDPDREALALALERLAEDGRVELPRSRSSWDDVVEPPLPKFVTLVAENRGRSGRESATEVAWAPELAWAGDIDREDQREVLLAVQRFLAEGGRERPMVPERERSVELFGDEKRLERLRKGALFRPGRLSLGLLRCFAVSPPLVWEVEHEADSSELLVVENHHTYHSFCRWNQRTRVYRAVVYGAGRAFVRTAAGLRPLVEKYGVAEVSYFGDLDPQGVSIPAEAAETLAEEGLPVCKPAVRWYELLLDLGQGRVFELQGRAGAWESAVDWMPEPLRERVGELFRTRRRLPQELLGWEVLRKLDQD